MGMNAEKTGHRTNAILIVSTTSPAVIRAKYAPLGKGDPSVERAEKVTEC